MPVLQLAAVPEPELQRVPVGRRHLLLGRRRLRQLERRAQRPGLLGPLRRLALQLPGRRPQHLPVRLVPGESPPESREINSRQRFSDLVGAGRRGVRHQRPAHRHGAGRFARRHRHQLLDALRDGQLQRLPRLRHAGRRPIGVARFLPVGVRFRIRQPPRPIRPKRFVFELSIFWSNGIRYRRIRCRLLRRSQVGCTTADGRAPPFLPRRQRHPRPKMIHTTTPIHGRQFFRSLKANGETISKLYHLKKPINFVHCSNESVRKEIHWQCLSKM